MLATLVGKTDLSALLVHRIVMHTAQRQNMLNAASTLPEMQ